MKRSVLLSVVVCLLAVLVSCPSPFSSPKDKVPPPAGSPPPIDDGPTPIDDGPDEPYNPGPFVYAVGFYNDGALDLAAYWKSGAISTLRTVLYTTGASSATGIVVKGTDIYISGYYNDGISDKVAYWKNGTAIELESGGRATGIAVADNGTVYISGYYNNGINKTAAYWVDNGVVTRHILHDATVAEATGIGVSGVGVVYISGSYRNGATDTAAYWVDSGGVPLRFDLYLTGLSLSNGIVFDGSNVYVSGRYLDGSVHGGMWKNDSLGLVVLNTSNATARSIIQQGAVTLTAGDYLGGDSIRRAAYWSITGASVVQTNLFGTSGGTTSGYGIVSFEGDTYVSGGYTPAALEEAVYWKNGSMTALDPGVRSQASALVVVP